MCKLSGEVWSKRVITPILTCHVGLITYEHHPLKRNSFKEWIHLEKEANKPLNAYKKHRRDKSAARNQRGANTSGRLTAIPHILAQKPALASHFIRPPLPPQAISLAWLISRPVSLWETQPIRSQKGMQKEKAKEWEKCKPKMKSLGKKLPHGKRKTTDVSQCEVSLSKILHIF